MNYFAHALPFLDNDPYFVAGTAVPDWLAVADRDVRVRSKHARPMVDDPQRTTAAVARGLLQHFGDDGQFHETRAFAELSLELTRVVRDMLGGESGLRPRFLGHVLVEVLLDAALVAEAPHRLESYYRMMLEAVDPPLVQEAVNRIAPSSTDRLSGVIVEFCRERFLWDYLEDGKLLVRLNQVMSRVGLAQLPESFCDVLPQFRQKIGARKDDLLIGIPVA